MKLKVLGKYFANTIAGHTIPNVRQTPIRPPPKATPTRFSSTSQSRNPCRLQSTSEASVYQENPCQEQVFGSQGHATSENEYFSFFTNDQISPVKQPRRQQNFLENIQGESHFPQCHPCSVSSAPVQPVCSHDPIFSRCSAPTYQDRNVSQQQYLRNSSHLQFPTDNNTSVFSPPTGLPECFLYNYVDREAHHSTSSSELSDDIQDIDTFDFNSSTDNVFTPTQMELPAFETFLPRTQGLEPNLAMLDCDSVVMPFPMENEEETSSHSSSCSSMEEETHYVTLSSYTEAIEDYSFKTESTLDDYFSYPPPELLSPSQDSEGYESTFEGGIPYSHCNSINSVPELINRPQNSPHSEDDGFFEYIPEETLPDFNLLQNQTNEHVRATTQGGQKSCSPKEKKHKTRDSPSTMERERRKPGRKPGQVSNVLHLWEFMRDLLRSPSSQGIIEWISRPEGVFRVVNSTEVARLWGEKKKNKKKMTYEKLSRSLRYSRLEGYFSDLPKDKNYPKKLCFKFGPKSNNWH
ncbi:unnamed protein product [Lymnaea stagnalis]|uniref:ETS domain-containing protein n=1 Tax=Lymnaea stagnalis TaxID=6523 RepID=A0AAV2GZ56_LYMST